MVAIENLKAKKERRVKPIMTISEADEQLAFLCTREAQLAAMLAQAGTRLEELEARAGDAYLDGDEHPMAEVAELRLQVDTLNAALVAIERRREPARLARRLAEAAQARRQAADMRSELADLEAKTAKHLEALSKLEGVEFTSGILSSQPAGSWRAADWVSDPEPWRAARELHQEPAGAGYATPRSRRLRQEIEDLEQQALAIERELDPTVPERAAPTPLGTPRPHEQPCSCRTCTAAAHTAAGENPSDWTRA